MLLEPQSAAGNNSLHPPFTFHLQLINSSPACLSACLERGLPASSLSLSLCTHTYSTHTHVLLHTRTHSNVLTDTGRRRHFSPYNCDTNSSVSFCLPFGLFISGCCVPPHRGKNCVLFCVMMCDAVRERKTARDRERKRQPHSSQFSFSWSVCPFITMTGWDGCTLTFSAECAYPAQAITAE